MFKDTVQPPILSFFSSTSTDCLSIFSVVTDASLPSSFVHLLEDETSLPPPSPPKTLLKPMEIENGLGDSENESKHGFSISAPVLHIQSSSLQSTYIICPPLDWKSSSSPRDRDLGVKLGWLHMQIRNLGKEWAFEIGVVDQSSREGRIRFSTFQKQAAIKCASWGTPILHIPLRFPPASSRPLTAWCTISLQFSILMSHFSSLPPPSNPPIPLTLPNGRFSHVSYVKVYANCRLRRIWFTAEKLDTLQEPWEFGLYSS